MITNNKAMVGGAMSFMGRINGNLFGTYYSNASYPNIILKDIDFKNGRGLIIGSTLVGALKRITYYKTNDNGNTWYGSSVVNSNINPVTFTTIATVPTLAGQFPFTLPSNATTKDVNAIHIFDNMHFVGVGEGSTVVYGDLTTANQNINHQYQTTNMPNLTSAILTDVTFVDDKVGYIVGSTGVSWRTKSASGYANYGGPIPVSAPPSVVQFEVTCDLPTKANNVCTTTSANINLTTVNFPSRLDGFIGGSNSACSSYALYAQLYHSESGLYSTRFWYDKLGRLILSQNTKQFNGNGVPGNTRPRYSYTLYDELGRIKEVGEKLRTHTD